MLIDYKEAQPIAYKILSNAIVNNQFNHAYLFETKGYESGLDMAISFAKSILNIQDENIDEQNYPELKIIYPDGQWIKKEQLKELQEEFNKKSILGNNKVYIINQAEKLNVNSANTILKFIEEPPEGIVAILVTDNIYQLLETIISRCQIISLNGQANIDKMDSTVSKIGKYMCDTNIDYENFMNSDYTSKLENIIRFIKYYENNGKKILLYMNDYWFSVFADKQSIYDALQIMLFFYKDCLNLKISCEIEIFNDYTDDVKDISLKNDISSLMKKIRVINNNKYYINNNANINVLMEKKIIEMEESV